MIPIYGFLEGDTIGLLLLCRDDERLAEVREKLERSARLRAAPPVDAVVVHEGRELEDGFTVAQAGIRALDRIDVRRRSS